MNAISSVEFWKDELFKIFSGEVFLDIKQLGSVIDYIDKVIVDCEKPVYKCQESLCAALRDNFIENAEIIILKKRNFLYTIELIEEYRPAGGYEFLIKHINIAIGYDNAFQHLLALGSYLEDVSDISLYGEDLIYVYKKELYDFLELDSPHIKTHTIFKLLHLNFISDEFKMKYLIDSIPENIFLRVVTKVVKTITQEASQNTEAEFIFLKKINSILNEKTNSDLGVKTLLKSYEKSIKYQFRDPSNNKLEQALDYMILLKKGRLSKKHIADIFRKRGVLDSFLRLASLEPIDTIDQFIFICINASENNSIQFNWKEFGFDIKDINGNILISNMVGVKEYNNSDIATIIHENSKNSKKAVEDIVNTSEEAHDLNYVLM